jgi:shikimate dehydrogenase
MPHKVRSAELVDTLTDEARQVGAVNVIRREANATLSGTMLDGEGFVSGLAAAGHPVRGARCILFGAGGAASSVAVAPARRATSATTSPSTERTSA